MSSPLADRLRRAKPASAEPSTLAADGGPPDGPGRRSHRVRVAVLATVLLVAAATAAAVAPTSTSPSPAGPGARTPPGEEAATAKPRPPVQPSQGTGPPRSGPPR